MSRTIDTRVVEMKFDNAAFENGVRQSTKTLANLDKVIDDQVKRVSSMRGPLSAVSSLLGKVIPTDQILSAASSVGNAVTSIFSTTAQAVGTVSKIGLGALTAMGASLTAMAASGGMKRALNIEQAKFQLEGLHVAWNDIKDDLDYAVSGTAYGLDAAAKAASQLVASNVNVGEEMRTALRGISGVAAMTNREYEDISRIFTTIAGQGRVMGDQLNQLAGSGLNAAAVLANALGVTEAEVRDMVSKGKIDFATFAKAMDDAFGQHAKDANKTFTGSISNVKAALSRIGEGFATPFLQNSIGPLNAFRDALNAFKTSLKPVYDEVEAVMPRISEKITNTFKKYFDTNFMIDSEHSVRDETIGYWTNTFKELLTIAGHFGKGVSAIFSNMGEQFEKVFEIGVNNPFRVIFREMFRLSEFITKNANFPKTLANVFGDTTFYNIAHTIDLLVSALERVGTNAFLKFQDALEAISPLLGEIIAGWNAFVRAGLLVAEPIINAVVGALNVAAHILADFYDMLYKLGINSTNLDKALSGLATDFVKTTKKIGAFLAEIFDMSSAFDSLYNALSAVGRGIRDVLGVEEDNILAIFGNVLSAGLDHIVDQIIRIGEAVSKSDIAKNLAEIFAGIRGFDVLSVGNFAAFTMILTRLEKLLSPLKAGFKNLEGIGRGWTFANWLGIADALYAAKNVLYEMQGEIHAHIILNIALAIASLAGAMILMASIDPDNLVTVAVSMGLAVATLVRIIEASGKAFGEANWKPLLSATAVLFVLGSSFMKLAIAMKVLASIDMTQMLPMVLSMMVAIGAMTTVIDSIAAMPEGTVLKGASVIKAMGLAFIEMALAMKILSTINLEQGMPSAFGGMVTIILAISTIVALLGSNDLATKNILAGTLLFIAIGPMFIAIAAAIKLLSTIKIEEAGSVLLTLIPTLGMLALLVAAISLLDAKTVAAASLAIFTITNLLLAIGVSVKILSSISNDDMGTALIGLAGALSLLIGSIAILAAFDIKKLTAGLYAIQQIAVVMLELSLAIKLLSTMPIPAAITAVATLAAVLAVIGAAAVLIPPVKLLLLATSMQKMALSAIALSVAFTMASIGVLAIVTAIVELVTLITQIGSDIATVANGMGVAFASMFAGLVTSMDENSDDISHSLAGILVAMVTTIVNTIPAFVEAGMQCLTAVLKGIGDSIGAVVSAGIEIVVNLLLGIASMLGPLISAGIQLIVMFISGVADAIRTNRHMIWNAVVDLMSTIGVLVLEGLAEIVSHIPIFGEDMAKGLRDAASELESAADEASSAIHKEFDEKNGDIIEGTGKTLAELKEMISGSSNELGEAGEGAGSTITNGFLSTLGIDTTLLGELNITADNFESMIPVLSSLSGRSGEEILSSFTEYTANLPEVAEDVSQEAADNMEAVDYETPGETNATEYAEGIDNDAYKAEDSASAMAGNAADSAEGEAWRGEGAGNSLSDNYSYGIDTHAGDDDGYWIVANTIAEMEGQDYRATNVGENLVQGLINGMQKLADDVYTLANNIASGAAYAMEVGAVVQSPSKLTTRTGRYITMGLIKGMKSLENESISSAEGIGRNTALAMSGFASLVDSIDWNANPTITPVLDTSLVESGLNDLDGLFTTSQARQAGWAAGNYTIGAIPVSNNQNGNTNNVTVMLNYDASADANELVMGIARALRTNVLMEG